MSVCVAWIKNGKGYLIADTLTSSIKNITLSPVTPFLQEKEALNGYYVEEEGLKIFEITKDIAIAVAGNVRSYSEILQWIYVLKDSESITKLVELLKQNYESLLKDVEMIFLYKEMDKSKILVWDGTKAYTPENNASPIFIGCGAENTKFTEAVEKAVSDNNDQDAYQYLALVISFMQCLSMKLKTIRDGFGGTFYGLFISSKLQWMRDLEYVLLSRKGDVAQSISVIIRKSSIIISSSMENATRTLTNTYISSQWFAEYHNMKSVLRAVDTKEAFYYVYYGLKSNRIYLWEAKGILIRSDFRKWIRRGKRRTDYLYAIDPSITNLITSGKSKMIEPEGHILKTVGKTYFPFEQVSNEIVDQLRKVNVFVGYDFDFPILDCTYFNKEHIKIIRKDIEQFYNIVVIDYDFFCQQVLKSNVEFYHNEDFNLMEMHLDLLLRHCLQNDYYVEYSKIKIVVVKTSIDYVINGVDITLWFEKYQNCSFIISENKEKDFSQLLIYWIKEYYINEKYFHLGMNILIADSKDIGQILELLVPIGRRDEKAADWILVRMNNNETVMPGSFNYVNEEWAFLDLLNIAVGYRLQQKIAITEREQELFSGKGEDVIHDWHNNKSLFDNIISINPME